ncbi:MAG TPA: type I phosphomannose isomerase catalytic subunit [Steroidobacteraceae bacterium]
MTPTPLYPLRFEPIYQYRPWGGRRLADLFGAPLPGDGLIGEAWILSDRDQYPSVVADGPLKGSTIRQLLAQAPERVLGRLARHFSRFPLLLKFLDVSQRLSVQVHPSDAYPELLSPGDSGKDEAWVVLQAGPEACVYAGLKPGASAQRVRQAIASATLPELLASFAPGIGDALFIPAGAVHCLSDVVVFEAQQNSDVTFRLYDWGRVDPSTHQPRALQVDQAIACMDFKRGAILPQRPLLEATTPVQRQQLVCCDHFTLTRIDARAAFVVGAAGSARVLVGLSGTAQLEHAGISYALARGDVLLLAAEVGECSCRPQGAASVLELALPEAA